MEQQSYKSGLTKDGAFQPIKRAKFDKQRAENNARMERAEAKYLTQLRENGLNNEKNAGRFGKDLQELSKFSKVLTDELVAREEKENEEEQQRGMMLAYTEGMSPEQTQTFDDEESALRKTEEATRGVADKLEQKTGNVFVGERVRGLSGWAAYGYALGKAQQGGTDYMSHFTSAAANTSVVINTPDGQKEITLDTAKTPEEYAAVQAQIRSDFLRKYSGMNPALLNKYLFPSMREFETKRQMKWETDRTKEIKADRKTAADDSFYAGLQGSDPGQALLTYIETTASDVGGSGDARKNAVEVIKQGIKNGTIDLEDVTALLDADFTARDGSTQKVGKYWREFGDLKEELENEQINERTRQDNLDKVAGKEFADNALQDILARERNGEYITEEQKEELLLRARSIGYIDPRLSDLKTQDTKDDADMREMLTAKQQAGLPITAADLRNASPQVYREYAGQIKEDAGAYALTSKEETNAESEIKGLISDKTGEVEGLDKTPMWHRINRRAQAEFQYQYREASLSAASKDEAFEIAMGKVRNAIAAGKFADEYSTEADQEYGQRVADGKRTLGNWAKDGQLSNITSTVIPGTQDEVKQLEKYANGTGNIPPIYNQLASGLKDVSAFDLARAQYMAATGKDLVPPPAEEIASEQAPWFQRLLKFKPTSARTRQAMVGSGDRRFLDLVASKESASYGGYDAYNRGGSNGGHTAHGSGNSAEDGRYGKPISKLSVGEILKLHSDGQLHAAGRYQFIGGTFKQVVQEMGLSKDTIFDGATQDRMAMHRARWRVNNYGLNSLSQEWIGLSNVPQAEVNAAYNSIDPYNSPDVLSPGVRKLAYVTGNIGDGAAYTGEHLDVKDKSGQRFHYRALDKYVEIDDPEFGTISLGDLREKTNFVGDSWDQHNARESHGIDYGSAKGSKVYVKNGAKVISSVDSGGNGDLVTIELPDGRQFTFLHGTAK